MLLRIILGCAIAHELGHLLLGTNSHSGKGIMQRQWESNQFRQLMTGSLLFTTAQAQLMRAGARMSQAHPRSALTSEAAVRDWRFPSIVSSGQ
jgi:hypothetical protein